MTVPKLMLFYECKTPRFRLEVMVLYITNPEYLSAVFPLPWSIELLEKGYFD